MFCLLLGDQHNLECPPDRDILRENILADTKLQDSNNNSNNVGIKGKIVKGCNAAALEVISTDYVDSEVLSWNSCSSSSSRPQSRAWGADRIVGLKKEPGNRLFNILHFDN